MFVEGSSVFGTWHSKLPEEPDPFHGKEGIGPAMTRPQHHRAFLITVYWTLGLLFLGSVVHATESSLACPDWPTCFGTMIPEMTGGVFWEHLHRLVAGGLILFWGGAIYLAWKETPRFPWVLKAAWAGMLLLLVQAVFGGLTVLFLLPDAISTTHLGLAFLFLALSTVLAVVSAPRWGEVQWPEASVRHLSLIHISEPTRPAPLSRMPSSA